MKNTKQKLLILDIINNSKCHNTAEEIYNIARTTIPNISLGTVYRILNYLVSENSIRRIKIDSGIDHYDHMIYLHNHFICTKCGTIIDIENSDTKLLTEIEGNMVMSYEINYKGICKNCLEEE